MAHQPLSYICETTPAKHESIYYMRNEGTEAVSPTVLTIPSRWGKGKFSHDEAIEEIDRLAKILVRGADALCGLYLRICDTIRESRLENEEIRSTLSKHFPPPRVSEFIKIANAPEDVYRRYRAGFIGFRAALSECRGYRINSSEFLQSKKIRRAARRLIDLIGHGEVTVKGRRVSVTPMDQGAGI